MGFGLRCVSVCISVYFSLFILLGYFQGIADPLFFLSLMHSEEAFKYVVYSLQTYRQHMAAILWNSNIFRGLLLALVLIWLMDRKRMRFKSNRTSTGALMIFYLVNGISSPDMAL